MLRSWRLWLIVVGCLLPANAGAHLVGSGAGPRLSSLPRDASADPLPLPEVAEVVIVGVRKLSVEELLVHIRTREGEKYFDDVAQADLIRLAESHLCKPLKVCTKVRSDGRVNVVFEVREFRNIVRSVVYRHAKHVSVAELEALTGIWRGIPLNPDRVMVACYDIQQHLKNRGYYFANVTLEEGFSEEHDHIVFNITEGPKVRVRDIRIVGKTGFADVDRLRQVIASRRTNLLGDGGVYRPEVVTADVARLEAHFRGLGYLNVRVYREVDFTNDFDVNLVIRIYEGVRYHIGGVRIDGIDELSGDTLTHTLSLRSGDYYNESAAQAELANLTSIAGEFGYSVQVTKTLVADPNSPGRVHVHYHLEDLTPRTFNFHLQLDIKLQP